MKKFAMAFLIATVIVGGLFAKGDQEKYPVRDITTVVIMAPGGGTDSVGRILSAEMAKQLKVNINVVNVTGASGTVGMKEVLSKPADGYTLVGIPETVCTTAVMGYWENSVDAFDYYILGGSPEVLSVSQSSSYNTLDELIAAAKKAPGSIKAAAAANGGIHQINLAALEKGSGTKFNYIPYEGSIPSQNAALSGEVEVVVTSIAEQAPLLKAGKLKALAMLIPTEFKYADKTVPSAFATIAGLDKYLPIPQTIGLGISKQAPQAVKDKLEAAFKVAMQGDAVKKFANDNFYLVKGLSGAEASAYMKKLESLFAWSLADLGIAKFSPEKFGIKRP
ncbi:MAG: tripartite tricarboxylate transporter substrate binding protein [Treponemataceae bacterium]